MSKISLQVPMLSWQYNTLKLMTFGFAFFAVFFLVDILINERKSSNVKEPIANLSNIACVYLVVWVLTPIIFMIQNTLGIIPMVVSAATVMTGVISFIGVNRVNKKKTPVYFSLIGVSVVGLTSLMLVAIFTGNN